MENTELESNEVVDKKLSDVKQVFLNLPIPGYPHPLTVQAMLTDDLRLELAPLSGNDLKRAMANLMMNMLSAALDEVYNRPDPEEQKSPLIIPG